jgi:Icc-related predicted phosphoesterase
MKIVCISDTHSLHRKTIIPDGDILIHAGDFTNIGEKEIIIDFNNWLGNLPHKYKIVVAGNHDLFFENNSIEAQKLVTNAIYLNNSGVEIEGLKIWGSPLSPISPKFGTDWAFQIERGKEIRKYWENIPIDTDILITHGPPFGVLDKFKFGSNEGCKDLLDIVQNQINPKLHIYGHVHEAHGLIQIGETKYINASIAGFPNWMVNNKFVQNLLLIAFSTFKILKRLITTSFHSKPKKNKFTSVLLRVKFKPVVIDM